MNLTKESWVWFIEIFLVSIIAYFLIGKPIEKYLVGRSKLVVVIVACALYPAISIVREYRRRGRR